MGEPPPGAGTPRINFEHPPVTELVIALYHLPIVELRAQHIGLYWGRIRDRYPTCEQQSPITNPDTSAVPFLFDVPGEVFPMPRFWFSNEQRPTLIQVQRNAFILNWRRGATGDYPHYEAVVADFWQEFAEYKRFVHESVGGRLDVVQSCELTYINLIGAGDGFTTLDSLAGVVPLVRSLYNVQTDERTLTGLHTTLTCRINPSLLITLTIRLGARAGTEELIAIMELKAHGTPNGLSLDAARAWYESAHDATYRLFLDATAQHVQQAIWRPRA